MIDSNSVIYYLEGSFPSDGMSFMHRVINDIPNISIITKIEILGFKMNARDAVLMQDFVASSNLLDLSSDVIEKTIELRKTHKIKLPDAIIAATALVYDFILITRNVSDFSKFDGLTVINPYDM